jgi:prepilin-type N-terminal cleavage/methylation domain-containing protein
MKTRRSEDRRKSACARDCACFTLIEMLVVMSIISTLAGLLLPGLAAAREKSRRTACINNLKEIGYGLQMYADDYGEYIPPNGPFIVPVTGSSVAGTATTGSATATTASGDYTGQSTNKLRVLPGMEGGLGKLMRGNYVGQMADLFGCPSHTPFMPGIVKNAWAETGSVEGAYLWRETDASPSKDALCRLGVRYRRSYGVVMDNSTVQGLPEGCTHKWEWTNILYSDGRVAGTRNDPGCVRKVTVVPPPNPAQPIGPGNQPSQLVSYDTLFTHDETPEAMTQLWLNADDEAYK